MALYSRLDSDSIRVNIAYKESIAKSARIKTVKGVGKEKVREGL